MAIAAPTQLATINSNTTTQSNWVTASITFPTTGTAVLGLLLLGVGGTATAETVAVSDSAGNTWTVEASANNTGTVGEHTFVAHRLYPSAGGGTAVTVTASWGTAVNERFGWVGYTTGHDTTTPLDQTGTVLDSSAATSTTVTTSAANTAANDLGLAVFMVGNASGPTGHPPTGWTSLFNPPDATRTHVGAFAYQVVSGGSGSTLSYGAVTYTATTGGRPTASIATFKPAAAAAATPPRRPLFVSQAVQRSYQW